MIKKINMYSTMDTSICMAESFCCPPEAITMLLIGYTLNTKLKVIKLNRETKIPHIPDII